MIKIAETKYSGIAEMHYHNIQEYLHDVIQFYINCCDIEFNGLKKTEYANEINIYKEKETVLSWLKVILKNKSAKNASKKEICKLLNKNCIKDEFKQDCQYYKLILSDMLVPSKEIYIKKIVTSDPKELISIQDFMCEKYKKFKNLKGTAIISKEGIEQGLFYDIMESIFNYDRFSSRGIKKKGCIDRWDAYKLCSKLNVNVCPYCNRMYTVTIIKTKKNANLTRPELDHFFPQSKYPMFALSFYNLIPSCKICNSTFKRDDYLDIKSFLHPYLDSIDENYKFDYEPINIDAFNGDKEKICININNNGIKDKKSENSLKKFKIEEIYKTHSDVVADLVYKRRIYSDTNIKEIEKILSSGHKIKITREEIFNSIFCVPNSENIIDTPLGKLRKDISQKLKNIE